MVSNLTLLKILAGLRNLSKLKAVNSIEKFIIVSGIGLTVAWGWKSQNHDADLPALPDLPANSASAGQPLAPSDDVSEMKRILAQSRAKNPDAPGDKKADLSAAMNQVIAKMEDRDPDLRLDHIPDAPAPELKEAGTATLFDAAKAENEIDQLPRNSSEDAMAAALGEGRHAVLIRRMILNRRNAGKVADGEKLEALYIGELTADVDGSVRVLSQALQNLPKSDYREEHLIIRELANQLPDGHQKLQALSPDEEFQ